MFNQQHGQSCCTTCLSQCCMFSKHLVEVNLVKWDRTWLCVYVLLMVVFIASPLCSVLKYSKKLVDREKVLDVSDREAHAAEKRINVEYAQKRE